MKPPLQGVGILVTRPVHQARQLAALIAAEGGEPILFPVLEILGCPDPTPVNALIARLDEFDLAIFISPNAVAKAMELIRARREWPRRLAIAAIGRGSARELERHGLTQVLMPQERSDSEGLLEMPELQDMRGKQVVIFRGEGGREVLGDALGTRGAQLEYCECYRRAKPSIDPAPLLARWERGEVNAVTATSGESVRNLCDMLGEAGRRRLATTPLFVPHERIAASARGLGIERVTVTAAGDEGLITGLIEWHRHGTA
jgi:uroporphyrinogen-III synthase